MLRSAKTSAQRNRLIERWRASGIPQARFARQHHVHPRTFWGWVRDASMTATSAPRFVPVHVVDASNEDARSREAAVVEIVLPSGSRVRLADGVSPTWVVAIVKGLQTTC
jgi:transposase-like protein